MAPYVQEENSMYEGAGRENEQSCVKAARDLQSSSLRLGGANIMDTDVAGNKG